jgi:sugar/nucleoside kinase (ribokinase family)
VETFGVVGHIAIDRIIDCSGERLQLGGPPTYISLITHFLEGSLVLATKVGGDFPDVYASELADRELDISGFIIPNAKTTRFVLDYTSEERRLSLDSICVPIEPLDIIGFPESVILAPIVQEIPQETYFALESPCIALDPQGFVRKMEPGGSISLHPWCDLTLLSRVSVFKASERELSLVAGSEGWKGLERMIEFGVDVAIETRGREGARVRHGKDRMIVPAYLGEAIDMTGAGDAFMAGFFGGYVSGEDIKWCCAIGSASASSVVETVGPNIKITRNELYNRAERIKEGIIQLN